MVLDRKVLEITSLMRLAAQKEVLPRFGRVQESVKENYKDFKEIVTEADIKASEFILAEIRRDFPGSYSEEHLYDDRFNHSPVWQIDPVDGTQEFCAKMIGGFAMHAALLERSSVGEYAPRTGIVFLPGTDKLWFSDGEKIRFVKKGVEWSIPSVDRMALRGWVREVDPNQKLIDWYHEVGNKLNIPVEIVRGGGSGSSVSDLLEGRVNLVCLNYDYTKEWDTAMAEPLISSQKGFLTDLKGNRLTYNRRDPFNRQGYVMSTVFGKEEIVPLIPEDLLIKKL